MFVKSSICSFDKELQLYEMLDLDADGEQDIDVDVDDNTGGHSVQIHVRYVDNTMTLYHLRRLSGCPADYTLYLIETGQLDNIESK
jgi:hypothetical protein